MGRGTTIRVGVAGALLSLIGGGLMVAGPTTAGATSAVGHHPLYMPNIANMANSALQPPPVILPPVCLPAPISKCVPYNIPPAGQPTPINMAYFGGHVQVQPKSYLVLWGWGQPGAFSHTVAGKPTNDPDGAGAQMTAFLAAMGGTAWAGVQSQYYQIVNGVQQSITNPTNQLGGVWSDDANPIHNNVTGLELAAEAERAVKHFGITDLKNSQIVVAQPQNFTEAGFNSGAGYCAWHDYTQPQYYPGVMAGISFTNMPYVLNQAASCGKDSVNAAPAGDLDGVTIVLGHEVEETVTDPGAEDVIAGQNLGGWYDLTGYENGDKCAWVGVLPVRLISPSSVPGGANNIVGNDGRRYAVQSLWSNQAAAGLGYCAGAGNNLPL
jgi:hypothetical protein